MTSPSSVSTWIQRLRAGDGVAARPLWERYYARLVKLAREQLAGALRSSGPKAKPLPRMPLPEGPKDKPPYAHPYYWAGFVLVGDRD